MAELVGISEGCEYKHNATKKIENRIYVSRGNSKFAILFEQTTYRVSSKIIKLFNKLLRYCLSSPNVSTFAFELLFR